MSTHPTKPKTVNGINVEGIDWSASCVDITDELIDRYLGHYGGNTDFEDAETWALDVFSTYAEPLRADLVGKV